MRVKRSLLVLVLAVSAACSSGGSSSSTGTGAPSNSGGPKANVVLIVTDDQRLDSMRHMPQVESMPAWARFSNAFVHEPQCCPSRAAFLTGRYSHHHGVDTNYAGSELDESQTIATMLHDNGYRTGFFGKYLNLYPFGRGPYAPPGWDEWSAFGRKVDYYDYELLDGQRANKHGSAPEDYSTDVLASQARKFIETTPASDPLFLVTAVYGPHDSNGPPIPAPRHAGTCSGFHFEPSPNFNAHDQVSEPSWMGPSEVTASGIDRHSAAICETLASVDEAVVSIVETLKQTNRLDQTYIVLMSDNGYSLGEHRLTGKGHLYEESVHVPLLVLGPDVQPGSVDRLTSNVDVAPTILEWTATEPPDGFVDGRSFAAAARGEPDAERPDAVLLLGCRTSRLESTTQADEEGSERYPCGGYIRDRRDMGFAWGLRTATHKYVEYNDGYIQLFDLRSDPYELRNLGADPAQQGLIEELSAKLSRLRGPAPGRFNPPK